MAFLNKGHDVAPGRTGVSLTRQQTHEGLLIQMAKVFAHQCRSQVVGVEVGSGALQRQLDFGRGQIVKPHSPHFDGRGQRSPLSGHV